jgi:hypothetical protein
MNTVFVRRAVLTVVAGSVLAIAGCGDDSEPDESSSGDRIAETDQQITQSPNAGKRSFKPLELENGSGSSANSKSQRTAEQRAQRVLEKLQPLQVVIGKWRGTTFKKVGQFNSVEEVQWVWDHLTDETQPALVMATKTSPYLQQGRLTYLVDEEKFQFTAVDKQGSELTYVGEFTVPPQDVVGGNKTVQRSFKLELKSASPQQQHKLVKLVFNQQENDRYLLELYDKRDKRYDTVANQREETSFAVSEDYGENECPVSRGLGTISIPYRGKTYWVCCTGCEVAFKEDPPKYIAIATKRRKMKE